MLKKKKFISNVLIVILFVVLVIFSVNLYAQQQQPQQQQQRQQFEREHIMPEFNDAEVARFAEVLQAMEDAGFTEVEFLEMFNAYFQDPELQRRVSEHMD